MIHSVIKCWFIETVDNILEHLDTFSTVSSGSASKHVAEVFADGHSNYENRDLHRF